eukprot:403364912
MAGQLDKEMRNRLAPFCKISWTMLTPKQWGDVVGIDEQKAESLKKVMQGFKDRVRSGKQADFQNIKLIELNELDEYMKIFEASKVKKRTPKIKNNEVLVKNKNPSQKDQIGNIQSQNSIIAKNNRQLTLEQTNNKFISSSQNQDSQLSNLSQISHQTPPQQIQVQSNKLPEISQFNDSLNMYLLQQSSLNLTQITNIPIVKQQPQENESIQNSKVRQQIKSSLQIKNNPQNPINVTQQFNKQVISSTFQSKNLGNDSNSSSSSNSLILSEDEQMSEPKNFNQKLQEVSSLLQGQLAKEKKSRQKSSAKKKNQKLVDYEEEKQMPLLQHQSYMNQSQSLLDPIIPKPQNPMNQSQHVSKNFTNFDSLLIQEKTESEHELTPHKNELNQDQTMEIVIDNNKIAQQNQQVDANDSDYINRNAHRLSYNLPIEEKPLINKVKPRKSAQDVSNQKNEREMLMRVGAIEGKLKTITSLISELASEVDKVKELCLNK